MSVYRCYFFDKYALSRAEDIEAATDTLAIDVAESVIARMNGRSDFFEVWNRDRLIHKRKREERVSTLVRIPKNANNELT